MIHSYPNDSLVKNLILMFSVENMNERSFRFEHILIFFVLTIKSNSPDFVSIFEIFIHIEALIIH